MNYFHELQKTLAQLDPTPLLDFVRSCQGTLWLAGNGGSASTAQHWACDLSKAAGRRVQALGCNSAVLTAWANDEGYDDALAKELSIVARPGDALICLSCSGTSVNISYAIDQAREMRLTSMLVTSIHFSNGDAAIVRPDLIIRIPHTDYGIIEDATSAIGHWLTRELQQ